MFLIFGPIDKECKKTNMAELLPWNSSQHLDDGEEFSLFLYVCKKQYTLFLYMCKKQFTKIFTCQKKIGISSFYEVDFLNTL